ncbi:hypothetical protein H9P43_005975 [Blastocladiella emersonii ATCC 22665]|nr:hypothetical protein H9P43_005975 [Blastocladiella emersonii ATCC 22665]
MHPRHAPPTSAAAAVPTARPGDTLACSDLEATLKVAVVGSGSVGKSSLIRRFTRYGEFNPTYKKTVGVEYAERVVATKHGDVRLMLWDTAGQEEFDAVAQNYYHGSHAILLAFSVTDRGSFVSVANWKRKVDAVLGPGNVTMLLVANKVDELPADGTLPGGMVSLAEARQLAQDLAVDLFPVSVKLGTNVEDVFAILANRHMDRVTAAATITSRVAPAAPLSSSAAASASAPAGTSKLRSMASNDSKLSDRTTGFATSASLDRDRASAPLAPPPSSSAAKRASVSTPVSAPPPPLVFSADAAAAKPHAGRRPGSGRASLPAALDGIKGLFGSLRDRAGR